MDLGLLAHAENSIALKRRYRFEDKTPVSERVLWVSGRVAAAGMLLGMDSRAQNRLEFPARGRSKKLD